MVFHQRLLGAFLALSLTLTTWLHGGDQKTLKLKDDSDKDYGEIILPTRVLGIGLKDMKWFEGNKDPKKDPAAVKFEQAGYGILESRVFGDFTHSGVEMPFLVQLGPDSPGKKRKVMVFSGPLAWIATAQWKHYGTGKGYQALIKSAAGDGAKKASNAQLEKAAEKDLVARITKEQAVPAKYLSGSSAKDKKNGYKLGKNARKCMEKGYAYPFPHRMGDTQGSKAYHRYWASVFAELGCDIDVYPSPDWVATRSTKGVEKRKIGMVVPTAHTFLVAHFRNCTVFQDDIERKVPFRLFDDNFNGTYGDPKVDSIQIGPAVTPVGEKVFWDKKLWDLKLEPDRNAIKATLTESSVPWGVMRVEWHSAKQADLLLAIVKAGNSYFDLANLSEDDLEKAKDGGSKYWHDPVAIPAGKVELVGGLVRYQSEDEDYPYYVSFFGDKPFELGEGEKKPLRLGQDLTCDIGFRAEGEKRIITLGYPKGQSGETYRWFSPMPPDARLRVTGNESFKAITPGIQKLMRRVNDGKILMRSEIPYDDVLYAPENGPFKLTVSVDSLVFGRFDAVLERKDLAQ